MVFERFQPYVGDQRQHMLQLQTGLGEEKCLPLVQAEVSASDSHSELAMAITSGVANAEERPLASCRNALGEQIQA
jgi:hypothetical protein